MNGTIGSARTLAEGIVDGLAQAPELARNCDFAVFPPALHLFVVNQVIEHNHAPVDLGGQDCAAFANGAYTGEISAAMLADYHCKYVILGHSERRHVLGESNKDVKAKAEMAHKAGLTAIICVGETAGERDSGMENEVVEGQLSGSLPDSATAENTVIAYEPVWAIGTGKVATAEDVRAMHRFIRDRLKEKLADSVNLRILYGGSVKPDNAAEIMAVENVDGALIGGASLEAGSFLGIARAVA